MSFLTSSSNFIANVIESSATDHMTYCSQLFFEYIPCAKNRKICIANGTFSAIVGSGTVRVSPTTTLENVLHMCLSSCVIFCL